MKNLVEKLKEIESKVVENKDNFNKLREVLVRQYEFKGKDIL